MNRTRRPATRYGIPIDPNCWTLFDDLLRLHRLIRDIERKDKIRKRAAARDKLGGRK